MLFLLASSAFAADHGGAVRGKVRWTTNLPVALPDEKVPAEVMATLKRCENCHNKEPLVSEKPLLASEEGLIETLREPGFDVAATLARMGRKAKAQGQVSFTDTELAKLRAFITGEAEPPQVLPGAPPQTLPDVLPKITEVVPQLLPPQPGSHAGPITPESPGRAAAPQPIADATGMGEFIQQNCKSCHTGQNAFPAFVLSSAQFQQRLDRGDGAAFEWLRRLNSKAVHGEMLHQAGLSKTEGPGLAFKDQIAGLYETYLGKATRTALAGATFGATGATGMVGKNKMAIYHQVLSAANIPDPEFRRELLDFDSIWDSEGNPAWSFAPHDGDAGRRGARPVGIAPAGPVAPHLFQQVGGQWRWKEPFDQGFALDAGTQGLKKFVVIRFPRDKDGKPIKGAAGTESRSSNLRTTDLASPWAAFPAGTRIFEIMYTDKLGEPTAVDIVTREKRIYGDTVRWAADAVRQDSGPEKIREWVAKQLDRQTNPDYEKILASLDKPQRDEVRSTLGAEDTGGTPFEVNGVRTGSIAGTKSVVRGVSMETWQRMYAELPMESATGRRGWQLEPSNVFSGSHRGIPVNSQTCKNCHNQAGELFKDIFADAGLPYNSVWAYGQGPGYDGVLSAPWFTPQELQQYVNGNNVGSYRIRDEWRKFFDNYSAQKHDKAMYKMTGPQTGSSPLR